MFVRVLAVVCLLCAIAHAQAVTKQPKLLQAYGEVDLAAWKDGVLVIVEVKARDTYDAGAYALTPGGQHRIARAAQALAGRWRLTTAPMRFDLVVVGSGLLPRHERGAWFDEHRVG